MEFTTLTRRVTEFSGIEAGEIEADDKLKAGPVKRLRQWASARPGPALPDKRERKPGSKGWRGKPSKRPGGAPVDEPS